MALVKAMKHEKDPKKFKDMVEKKAEMEKLIEEIDLDEIEKQKKEEEGKAK